MPLPTLLPARARAMLFAAAIAGAAACASSNPAKPNLAPADTKQTLSSAPGWYLHVPNDPNYILGAATATSRDLQTAIDKAQLDGRGKLAQSYESRFSGMSKRFTEETGIADSSELLQQFQQTYKSVASTVLMGTRARQQEVKAEGAIYRVYVLMEMPIGAANAALMQKLRQNQIMYTRLRASQAFQELERDVKQFEDERGKQQGEAVKP